MCEVPHSLKSTVEPLLSGVCKLAVEAHGLRYRLLPPDGAAFHLTPLVKAQQASGPRTVAAGDISEEMRAGKL